MKNEPDTGLGSNLAADRDELPDSAKSRNPRRVLAGRVNRKKRGEITPQGRETLRQTALRNKPWRFSTGPNTIGGKAIAAANGRCRQKGPTSVRVARKEARAVRVMIDAMRSARKQPA
jgi:hypothetical protein